MRPMRREPQLGRAAPGSGDHRGYNIDVGDLTTVRPAPTQLREDVGDGVPAGRDRAGDGHEDRHRGGFGSPGRNRQAELIWCG